MSPLDAQLDALHRAFVEARDLARAALPGGLSRADGERIRCLMTEVHNLPDRILRDLPDPRSCPPHLAAAMRVLYRVSLYARRAGWTGRAAGLSPERTRQLVALLGATHNLPLLVQDWGRCDVARLRRDFRSYDEHWAGTPDGPLTSAWDDLP